MPARPFPNVAQRAYIRGGIVVDASKRITVEVLHSHGLTADQRQADQIRYNKIRDTEIIRNLDGTVIINLYSQIYKPKLRVCGGSLVNSAYSGTVSPISRLAVLSNETRTLTLLDFSEKRLPTVVVRKTVTRTTSLQTLLNFNQLVGIVSVHATVDILLVTTDNILGPMQVNVAPAFDPTVVASIATKASPAFTSSTTVASTSEWQIANGWSATSSSFNSRKEVWRGFDGTGTQWTSSGGFNASTRLGIAHPKYSIWRLTVTKLQPGSTDYAMIVDMKLYTGCQHAKHARRLDVHSHPHEERKSEEYGFLQVCSTGDCHEAQLKQPTINTTNTMPTSKNNNTFKQDSTNLARASYLLLAEAAKYGGTLGYTLDTELSKPNTMVFIDRSSGQLVIVHRGSVTAKDWLVDDALIAVGAHKNTDKLNLARSITDATEKNITDATEKNYNRPTNSVGHSLGGRLAEQSGSGGQIVTINKAAGLGDIGLRQPSGTRQTDVRTKLNAVSALSSLGRRPESQGIMTHTLPGECGKIAQFWKSSMNNGKSTWTLAGVISESFRACFKSHVWHLKKVQKSAKKNP
ncbi:hypothetical protein T492DRAFT_831851 [Pavlovales sp. CCMP2436]|nr:hypothetical protein T492DRAFT_831851 [Pavlovales sp. CCMP2436]